MRAGLPVRFFFTRLCSFAIRVNMSNNVFPFLPISLDDVSMIRDCPTWELVGMFDRLDASSNIQRWAMQSDPELYGEYLAAWESHAKGLNEISRIRSIQL